MIASTSSRKSISLPDLKKIDKPLLIIQGDDDQIVPLKDFGEKTVKIVKGSVLKITRARRTASPRPSLIASTRMCSASSRRDPGRRVRSGAPVPLQGSFSPGHPLWMVPSLR